MALGAVPATAERPQTHHRPAQPGHCWEYIHTRPPATPTPSADHASLLFCRCRCLSFFARGMAPSFLFRTEIPSRLPNRLGLLITCNPSAIRDPGPDDTAGPSQIGHVTSVVRRLGAQIYYDVLFRKSG